MPTEISLDKKVSKILQDRAIPDYIKSEYPTFVSFLSAYFEWMEESKQPFDISSNLHNYRNIDNTIDDFVDYFRKEFLVNIPEEILANKALLLKNIKNFYLNKGNEASYKFLFRILYDQDIEFYFPKVDILRASDGKWYEQKSIKIILSDVSLLQYFSGKKITGATSSATGIVESVLTYEDRGDTQVVEIVLSDIRGTFQTGENITFTYVDEVTGDTLTVSEEIIELYVGINLTEAGSGYFVDEQIIIRDGDGNEVSRGIIKQVIRGPITGLNIEAAGLGYNGELRQVDRFYALPINHVLDGQVLNTAILDGSDDSNHSNFLLYTLDQLITEQNIASEGDIIQIVDGATSSGSGAFGIISLVGTDGEILEVTLLGQGNLYQSPTANIISSTGTGGEISIIGGQGGISKIVIDKFPIVLSTDEDSNGYSVYPDFTTGGDGNALGTMTVGPQANYPGKYLNQDGHLSSSKKLQDNFYYQDYSYVIKAGVEIDKWKDIVKKIIHPAGLAVFGEIGIIERFDCEVSFYDSKVTIIASEAFTPAAATFESSIVKIYVADSNGITDVPLLDSNGNHLIDF